MDNILATILKDTYTLRELKGKLNVLKAYLEDQFFNSSLKKEFSVNDLAWLKSLPPTMLESITRDNINNIFLGLQKQIGTLKVLTVYLAFEPDAQSLSQIGSKVRQSFPTLSLLDIKYDPSLIAGAAFVWNGTHRDYSLKSAVGLKRDKILENLKKFLH